MKETENEHGWMELLKKWLSGDATHTDESEMETRSHSDEFLAEALEGYREFPDDDHQWHLDNIRERLPRQKRRSPVLFYLPRIAAAVIVVIAAWWLLGPLLSSRSGELAQADEKIDTAIQKPEATDSIGEAQTNDLASEDEEARAEEQPAQTQEPALEKSEPGQEPTPPENSIAATGNNHEAAAKPTPTEKLLPAPGAVVKDQADSVAPGINADELAAPDKPASFNVSGKVLDAASGDPLIAASVQVLGSTSGTITDFNGGFTLPPQSAGAKLMVSYTGYENKVVEVRDNKPVDVRLQSASDELSEVVVTGKKTAKSKELTAASKVISSERPEPKGGWKKWKRHLRRNLIYPEQARSNGVTGEVTLRFVVDEDGNATKISVVKGLGNGCDEEAIRLLKSGPKWEPSGPATVSIRFE